MVDLSIIEYGVYGFLAYTSILMLIISVLKHDYVPTKVLAIARVIYLIPGMICSAIIALSGINIQMVTTTTANTIRSVNTTQVWTETTNQTNAIILQNNTWAMVHWLIFITLMFYVFTQVLLLIRMEPKESL